MIIVNQLLSLAKSIYNPVAASNEEAAHPPPPKRPATQTNDIADIQSRELSTYDKYQILKTQFES